MTTPSQSPVPEQPSGYSPPPAAETPQTASPASYPIPSYASAPPAGAPESYGAPDSTAGRPRPNVLGIIALAIGIVVMLSSTVSLFVQAAMFSSGDYTAIGVVMGIISVVQGLLAAAAIVCGAIGLALKGRAKGAAGVGLGIGVAALWSVLGGVLYGIIVQLLNA